MRIAIIGAGLTGLTAALRLSQKGHQVTVFEKEKNLGGLAAGFRQKNWQWSLEYFFHHLFTSDNAAKNLISELGLSNRLFYTRPKTSIFISKNTSVNIFRFDSPFSLLKFPYLSFPQKMRTGLATLSLKLTNNWSELEKIKAKEGLKELYGQKTYEILWKPLLKSKFGKFYQQISMAWFWARIKKRSTKLGYLEGSFQTLIDELAKKIKANGGQILLNQEITKVKKLANNFEKIIITTPAQNFFPEISAPAMLGALNLILILKKSFLKDGTYWLCINEETYPFVAVVEHTNFIDKSHYGGNHILYVGGYYPQNHKYFKMTKEAILKEWLPYLQKINPQFDFSRYVICDTLYANQFAQPVIPLNYSKIILSHQTPLKNVFLANMQQVYPWDRGVNYAIEMGEKIAQLVNQ